MNVIEEIKKLNFSSGEYVVVGSGPMAIRGLKEAHDIDIVVTPELFEKCRISGWEEMPWTYPEKVGQIYLKKGDVELYLDVNAGSFNPTTAELIERSETIQGVPFVTLKDMINFKKAYGREKHLKDIKIVEEYLLKEFRHATLVASAGSSTRLAGSKLSDGQVEQIGKSSERK